MSTRCSINFTVAGSDKVWAKVYRHYDGDLAPESLRSFFRDVRKQTGEGDRTGDTRFGDPEYLAAKYVVWQAHRYATPGKPLAFTGVGVLAQDPGDIAYIHTVACADRDTDPVVTSREVGEQDG